MSLQKNLDFSITLSDMKLSEFAQNMLRKATVLYPEHLKDFIIENANELNLRAKNYAKQEYKKKTGLYFKKFKVSKAYVGEGRFFIKVYNSSPHAHLLEKGHRKVPRGKKGESNKGGNEIGFKRGRYPLARGTRDFKPIYYKKIEKFIDEYFIKGIIK